MITRSEKKRRERREKGKKDSRKKKILTSKRSKVLQRSGLGGGGGDDNGVLHGVVLLERLDKLGDGGPLLADGNIDAIELLRLVIAVVPSLLVEDGVEDDSRLAGLTVTDDQLTLATADGNHGVDRLEARLHGLVDRLAGQNSRGLEHGSDPLRRLDGALAVDGVAQSIDDTAKHLGTNGNVNLGHALATCTSPRHQMPSVDSRFHRFA